MALPGLLVPLVLTQPSRDRKDLPDLPEWLALMVRPVLLALIR